MKYSIDKKTPSALEWARKIKKGQITPKEMMAEYVQKAEGNPHKAFAWLDPDQAASAAREWEEKGDKEAPFGGVPLPIKELTDVYQWPSALGSRVLKDRKGLVDTHAVTGFKKAGFVLAGTTSAPEFGTLPTGDSQKNGATENPYNRLVTTGGSSSGAAAVVASEILPLAHGSDGGGSIRIPASCCGLIGLKASRGRISKGPLVSESFFGMAVDGVLAQRLEDVAWTLDELSSFDPYAWYNAPKPERPYRESYLSETPRLKIAYTWDNPTGTEVDDEVKKAVEKAVRILESCGHEVTVRAPEWRTPLPELFPAPLSANMSLALLSLWNASGGLFPPQARPMMEVHNQLMFESGDQASASDYARNIWLLQLYSRKLLSFFGPDCDVLLTPTLGKAPVPHGWLFQDWKENVSSEERFQSFQSRIQEFIPYTPWFNLTGQPAISLPCDVSSEGLPIGVQLVGAPWREDLLLSLSRTFLEKIRGFA